MTEQRLSLGHLGENPGAQPADKGGTYQGSAPDIIPEILIVLKAPDE